MKIFTKTLFTLSLLVSLADAAPSALYLEVAGGLGLSDTYETREKTYIYEQGYIASVKIGYQAAALRFEFEQRYKADTLHSLSAKNSYPIKTDGAFTTNSQMLNLSYSGYNHSKIISTIGLGAGVSSIVLEDIASQERVFSAQALATLGYKIDKHFVSSFSYSYFYTAKSDDFQSKGDNTLTLSLRYLF